MKRLLFILSLFISVASVAQLPTVAGFTKRNVKEIVIGTIQNNFLAIPSDTFVVATQYKDFKWMARKGDSTYMWSKYQNKWILNNGATYLPGYGLIENPSKTFRLDTLIMLTRDEGKWWLDSVKSVIGVPTWQQTLGAVGGSTITTDVEIEFNNNLVSFNGINELTLGDDVGGVTNKRLGFSPTATYIYGEPNDLGDDDNFIELRRDSILFFPLYGKMNIDSLRQAPNMTNHDVMVWDKVHGNWEHISKDSIGGGGGSTPTLQQVLTAGNTTDVPIVSTRAGGAIYDAISIVDSFELHKLTLGLSGGEAHITNEDFAGNPLGTIWWNVGGETEYASNGSDASHNFYVNNVLTAEFHVDSTSLKPPLGRLNIDSLNATVDTTNFKPMVWNPTTGQVKRGYWFGAGGGVPTLQQVFDKESGVAVFTGSNTIDVNNNDFTIDNIERLTINSNDEVQITNTYIGNLATIGMREYVILQSDSAFKRSSIEITKDSISLMPYQGNLNIDTLNATVDTTNFKPIVWNPVTGQVKRANWFGSGGGSISLTAGSVGFGNGTTITEDNSKFFWDDTNKSLIIGKNSVPSSGIGLYVFNTGDNSEIRVGSFNDTYFTKLFNNAGNHGDFYMDINGNSTSLQNFFLRFNGTTQLTMKGSGILNLTTAPTTSAGSYDIITRNTSTGDLEKIASTTFPTGTGTANYLAFWTGTNTLSKDINLQWDGSTFTANGTAVLGTTTFKESTVTTTDATATTIATIPTASNTTYLIECYIVAYNTTDNTVGTFTNYISAKNIGGTVTILNDVAGIASYDGAFGGVLVATGTSGTNILPKIQGMASKTINWKVQYKIVKVS